MPCTQVPGVGASLSVSMRQPRRSGGAGGSWSWGNSETRGAPNGRRSVSPGDQKHPQYLGLNGRQRVLARLPVPQVYSSRNSALAAFGGPGRGRCRRLPMRPRIRGAKKPQGTCRVSPGFHDDWLTPGKRYGMRRGTSAMAERGRTVFLVVGASDRHQRRLVNWARRANPLVQVSQPGSISEAQVLLQALEHPKNTSVVIYVRSLSASSDDQQRYETQTSLHRPRWPDSVGQPKLLRFIEF